MTTLLKMKRNTLSISVDAFMKESFDLCSNINYSFLQAQVPWVVTSSEKAKSDAVFATVDTDHDGLVSGLEIRGIMVQSGLPNTVLAHIW